MAEHLHCMRCGKQVSTGFYPVPTETPDKGLIVRAWIECPECLEEWFKKTGVESVSTLAAVRSMPKKEK